MSQGGSSELMTWLSSVKIRTIMPKRDVISLEENDVVETVLQTLAYNKILGAPVYSKEKKKVLGLVDVLDIVTFLSSLIEDGAGFKNKSNVDSFFRYAPVKKVMDASQKNPFCPVFAGASVLQLIEVFGAGVHRVPLYQDNENDIVNLVSHRDVFNFLYKSMDRLSLLTESTLDQICFNDTKLPFGRENLVSVSEDEPLITAIDLLNAHKVSALAVTNKDGDLTSHISASDMRTLQDLDDLALSVADFIIKYNHGKDTVIVEPDQKMGQIFHLIDSNRLHRVWIVEENTRKPIGVFSLTDIMNAVAYYATLDEVHIPRE